MQSAAQKLLVVGGNGFIGSAVCRAALLRGYEVTSVSSSGKPFRTPKGHAPAWTSKVDWQQADAFRPETYTHLLPGVTAVVHTLGTLLEDTKYKDALRKGDVLGALTSFVRSTLLPGGRNPLEAGAEKSYERLNRDAALCVAEAFFDSKSETPATGQRAFVFLSAEDIFRPLIPARYIETKREAEAALGRMVALRPEHFRTVYVRPSLVYHPHLRPLTTPVAALLDLSSVLHSKTPQALPTPSSILRTLAHALPGSSSPFVPTSPLDAVANALTLPPIHVDHVAEAAVIAADCSRTDVRGVYGVREIRELIGWARKGERQAETQSVHSG
ncbi:mitochondrial protein [Vararia minispora EC-137]|uniref:Mitochondrial protein n=1 Tax=Vararia minispora EC-137 TaxID=1314806 RepID=A0ACB8QX19_9AGAM|nr:mitochondrial protein [Vararia minispora EC-137]